MTCVRRLCATLILMACSKPDGSAPKGAGATAATSASVAASGCPATGMWAECSVLYRLDRAGLAPQVDSGAKPAEKALTGRPLVIKIGRTATLELFIYADSVARIGDGAKLDRTHLLGATAEQTAERERTLIENANVIGLLTSLSSHQRERVSDALTAGPPQPRQP